LPRSSHGDNVGQHPPYIRFGTRSLAQHGCEPATPAEARQIMGLPLTKTGPEFAIEH